MEKRRFLIEIGTGVDMHGGSMTRAAQKAVKDAMSHCCMAGIREIHGAGPERIALRVQISCPRPEELDLERVKEPVGFYDDVELVFDKEALEAVAEKAIERNIGARGLRAVMEGILTSIMYDIPSDPTITKVTITAACVKGEEAPRIDRDPEKASRPARLKGGKNEGEKSRSNPASAS